MSLLINSYRFGAGGGGGGSSDPLDPDNYTIKNGGGIASSLKETVSGTDLHIQMVQNSVGAGKVLFKPGSNIESNGGVIPSSGGAFGFAAKISNHLGWDGTAAWLGFGLGVVDADDNLASIQLNSRNSATGEFGHYLGRTDGFITSSTSSWTSVNTSWGEDAISPKTVPIYVGCRYDGTTDMVVYKGTPDSVSGSWASIRARNPSGNQNPDPGDEYGMLLFALTGTQTFDIFIEAIEWDWDGSSWPATF